MQSAIYFNTEVFILCGFHYLEPRYTTSSDSFCFAIRDVISEYDK